MAIINFLLFQHPGGGDLITEWAGKDGTKAFDDFGHSGDAKKDLKKYKIGELRDVISSQLSSMQNLQILYFRRTFKVVKNRKKRKARKS